jgi:hypothetical protein
MECLRNQTKPPAPPDFRYEWNTYPGGPSEADLLTMALPTRRNPLTGADMPNPKRFVTQYIIDKERVYRVKYDDPRYSQALGGAIRPEAAADDWTWRGTQCSWF